MTSYIYYDCGCAYSFSLDGWGKGQELECENLCDEHAKDIDDEDKEPEEGNSLTVVRRARKNEKDKS